MATRSQRQRSVIPGFRLTLGFTTLYLALLVIVPLAGVIWKTGTLGWREFWQIVTTPRVLSAFRLTLVASATATAINAVFGFLLAWVLCRYRVPFRRILDAAIDLPLAMPTAVAGIALTAVYAPTGWLGKPLAAAGFQIAYAPPGVILALTFVGLPFVTRTLQPVLRDLDRELEEAATSLGARPSQTFLRVLLPTLAPAWLTGCAVAFARALGEYGSIVFISGNLPFKTEIATLLIMAKLEQYDYAGASAIGTASLLLSFVLLLMINVLQTRAARAALP